MAAVSVLIKGCLAHRVWVDCPNCSGIHNGVFLSVSV